MLGDRCSTDEALLPYDEQIPLTKGELTIAVKPTFPGTAVAASSPGSSEQECLRLVFADPCRRRTPLSLPTECWRIQPIRCRAIPCQVPTTTSNL